MKALDKFIALMFERGADALLLAPDQPVHIRSGERTDPLTRQPVTAAQIEKIVTGSASTDTARAMADGEPVSFPYGSPAGAVSVAVEPGADGLSLSITPGSPGSDAKRPEAESRAQAATTSVGASRQGTARIDELLRRLLASGGSDLHMRVGQPPILRRDGGLNRESSEPLSAEAIEEMLHSIMGARDRELHNEEWDADFAYEIAGEARFRVNAAVDRNGPMAVFRVIPSDIPTCEDVAVPQAVQDLCLLTKGLVVVTGPTGSGKSTTLAAMVDKMNREREDHILTIEDPIEFVHQSRKCLITHRQVGEHTKSFKSGLRAALREDPDIILIGELRDLETVAIAIETAETGHLVFGTLHTTTAASTVERIIDQFPADQQSQIRVMLSESLRGVVAQTLLRRKGGGRVAAREVLLSTPAISNLIREGKTFQIPSIMQTSKKHGMCTLNDSLMELVDRDLVEPKEAYMKSADKVSFLNGLKAKGIDTSFVGS
jgi:twitching motility protein PilT